MKNLVLLTSTSWELSMELRPIMLDENGVLRYFLQGFHTSQDGLHLEFTVKVCLLTSMKYG